MSKQVYVSLDWSLAKLKDDTDLGEFRIVGHNSDTRDSYCGKIRNVEVKPDGKSLHKTWCFDPNCPVCFQAWASMEAKKKAFDIWCKYEMIKDAGYDIKLSHITVNLDAKKHTIETLTLKKMIKIRKSIVKVFKKYSNVYDGMFVTFHPASTKKGNPKWVWQPHFHIITTCKVDKTNFNVYRKDLEKKKIFATVVNICIKDINKKKFPEGKITSEEMLGKIIKYELSHCFSTKKEKEHHHFSYMSFCNNKNNPFFERKDDTETWVIKDVVETDNYLYEIKEVEPCKDAEPIFDEYDYRGDLNKMVKNGIVGKIYFTIGEKIKVFMNDYFVPKMEEMDKYETDTYGCYWKYAKAKEIKFRANYRVKPDWNHLKRDGKKIVLNLHP